MKRAALVLSAFLGACSQSSSAPTPPAAPPVVQPTPPPAPPQPREHVPEVPTYQGESAHAGKLRFRVGAPLVARAPSSRMRVAEYAVPGTSPDEEVSLAIFYFGRDGSGTVDENVARWFNQMQTMDGAPATRDAQNTRAITLGALHATLVDVSGTLAAALPGGPGPVAAKANQRLLGAIVEGPEGLVFFKMTGPIVGVERARQAFEAMLQSVTVE